MSTDTFELVAELRTDAGKGASRRLRRAGRVPGIIYGAEQAPEMISVVHNELIQHLEHEAFYSHILTVTVAGKSEKVVLKDLQRHPAKPFVTHLDLLRVSSTDKIKMHVPLHFTNEEKCPAVKLGGQVSHNLTDVEISCLPKDLPEYIEIDMTELEVGAQIHMADLKLPEGVELATQPTEDHNELILVVHGKALGSDEEEEGEGEGEAE